MNNSFKALTLFPCDALNDNISHNMHNPYWRQSVLGCSVLEILQDMYNFSITYVVGGGDPHLTNDELRDAISPPKDSIDIFVKPLSISENLLNHAVPIQAIFNWRIGFILRDDDNYTFKGFYSLPFTRVVWWYIFFMTLIASMLFYVLGRWELRLTGRRCSAVYEVFIAVSAVCQHILPLHAVLCSRRIAYFSFIMSTYIIHCFYTSNLLSRLVNERQDPMDLEELAASDYNIALLKDMKLSAARKLTEVPLDKNLSSIIKKVNETKTMALKPALDAVMYENTALITDFETLYPIFKKLYPIHEICELLEIDVYSSMQHYLITSKEFLLIEEFRTGITRLRETGILQALSTSPTTPFACKDQIIYRHAELEQVYPPILLLLGACVLSAFILIGEKIHFTRYRLWPYTE